MWGQPGEREKKLWINLWKATGLESIMWGLSISSAKSYLWLNDGCFLLCFLPASPVLSHLIPSWEDKGSFARQLGGWVGATLLGFTTHCLGIKGSDHFWQRGWKKARSTESSGLAKHRGTSQC